MGLKHLQIRTESIETSGGTFTVRGLSLPDVVAIFEADKAELSGIFQEISSGAGGLVLDDMGAFAAALTQTAPKVVARVIAVAADEEDVGIAAALPFPVQIDALEKIARLTFATEGAAKKVMETIIRMVQGARAAVGRLP